MAISFKIKKTCDLSAMKIGFPTPIVKTNTYIELKVKWLKIKEKNQ